MSNELKYPAYDEKSERDPPKSGHKKAKGYKKDRDSDHRDSEAMHQPVYRVLVTFRIFLDPIVPRSSAHHINSLRSLAKILYQPTPRSKISIFNPSSRTILSLRTNPFRKCFGIKTSASNIVS